MTDVALRAGGGMLVGALLAGAVPVALLFPYHRDDRELDHIVRVVALDARDFGAERARTRLDYELDRARIGGWVGDEDCAIRPEATGPAVRCDWEVDLHLPVVDVRLPLRFSSSAEIGVDGDLR